MGGLILPSKGSVYIDANIVIYAIEKIEPYAGLLAPLWLQTGEPSFTIITSELTWLETLTKPLKDRNSALAETYRAFLKAQEMKLIPVSLAIWEEAAQLRCLGLKTPDALHAATAMNLACELFLTNDKAFTRIPNLPVAVLGNFIQR